jgi:hypothetical protein
MKTWLTASDIAALELPGIPKGAGAARAFITRHEWHLHPTLARPRSGRGGGLEFSIDLLPADARSALVARYVDPVELPAAIAREAAREPEANWIGGRPAEARDARLALLAAADRFAAQSALLRKRADQHFCDCYNLGRLSIAAWIVKEVKSVTPRTLKRWRKFSRAGQRSKLAVDRSASRKGTGILDRANGGAVKTFILALIAKQPQLTAHHIRALTAERYNEFVIAGRTVKLPPVRTFQNTLKAWRADYRVEIEAIRNPDGFKSRIRFSARNGHPACRINELWQIDASPADVLTTDGRYSLYLCEDIYSRRLIGLVSKTARASGVGLLIRKAILSWGVPERIKTDNGSDFVARETQRLFAALAIEHETAAPFSPEQKGHIERAIGTLQRGLMRTLPGFIGHSVADRKVIENRKAFAARLGETPEDTFQVALTATDLQKRVDEWCADVYGRAPHAGLSGQSPFAVAAMSAAAVRRIDDIRALDMLLAPVAGKDGLRTITKTGLRIDGAHYLAGFLTVGDTVLVRMDPADLGRVFVFEPDGLTFLGEAVSPELAGIDPARAIHAVRAEQKRLIDERMAPVKREARRIRATDLAPAIHRQALADAGTLVEFPKATENHDTPALAAARQAGRDNAPVHSPEIVALSARLRAEAAAPDNVAPLRVQETPHQRWNRARGIERALEQSESVDAADLIWLGGYRTGPEYRGFKLTYEPAAESKRLAEAGQQLQPGRS